MEPPAERRRNGASEEAGGNRPRSRHRERRKDSSSIGRAPVSKTGGWGFDSLLSCHIGQFDGRQMAEDLSERNGASDEARA